MLGVPLRRRGGAPPHALPLRLAAGAHQVPGEVSAPPPAPPAARCAVPVFSTLPTRHLPKAHAREPAPETPQVAAPVRGQGRRDDVQVRRGRARQAGCARGAPAHSFAGSQTRVSSARHAVLGLAVLWGGMTGRDEGEGRAGRFQQHSSLRPTSVFKGPGALSQERVRQNSVPGEEERGHLRGQQAASRGGGAPFARRRHYSVVAHCGGPRKKMSSEIVRLPRCRTSRMASWARTRGCSARCRCTLAAQASWACWRTG